MTYQRNCMEDYHRSELAVLVIAHGSPRSEWNAMVDQAVKEARLPIAVRVGFLSNVPERSIPLELAALEKDGARTVIVVPLFISAGSTHLNEIRYMLGLIPVPDIDTELRPIQTNAELIWCSPLDDADQAAHIWEVRLLELLQRPEQEVLLVIGHGSHVGGFRERWQSLLQAAASRLKQSYGLRQAAYATLLPDTVATTAASLAEQGRLLVLPLFISEGYFTQKAIPAKLQGLNYVYSGKTYLPHPLMADWIKQTVRDQLELLISYEMA